MHNYLLDGFPTEYKGYQLNTDFRVGILLTLLMEDESVDEDIKLLVALNNLYKNKVPDDINIAVDGLTWFLSCGRSEVYYLNKPKDTGTTDKCLDFNEDALDIWGAFWMHGVDLDEIEYMHWFKFMTAISNVGDCPLSNKISYRGTDLSKLKGDTLKYYRELKEKYQIYESVSKDEYEAYQEKLRSSGRSRAAQILGLM